MSSRTVRVPPRRGRALAARTALVGGSRGERGPDLPEHLEGPAGEGRLGEGGDVPHDQMAEAGPSVLAYLVGDPLRVAVEGVVADHVRGDRGHDPLRLGPVDHGGDELVEAGATRPEWRRPAEALEHRR